MVSKIGGGQMSERPGHNE